MPPPSQAGHLYHLALAGEWQDAVDQAQPYRRSTIGRSLEEERFIRCCFADQVPMIAERFYAGRDDVVLLVIDPSRVPVEVRVEAVDDGPDRFPHIYGALPLDAVVDVRPATQGATGRGGDLPSDH